MTIYKRLNKLFWLLALGWMLAGSFVSSASPLLVAAQGFEWSQPVNVTNSQTPSTHPSLAIDPSGVPHLVWQEEINPNQTALMYSRWENETWTLPNDIVVAENSLASVMTPELICDSQGYLHLIFIEQGKGLRYIKAFAPLAGSASTWQSKQTILPATNNLSLHAVAIGPDDQISLIYAIQLGANAGIYYLSLSADQKDWKGPYPIYLQTSASRMIGQPRIAVDGSGKLHAVWVEYNYPEAFPPIGIRYSSSTDGLIWSEPLSLADGPYLDVEIGAYSASEVHVVWSGTEPDRRKFHIWSKDSGLNWSAIYRNPELGGMHGLPGLAFDSRGRVYWLPSGGYYGSTTIEESTGYLFAYIFSNNVWPASGSLLMKTPPEVKQQNMWTVRAAVALGSELHVIIQDPRNKPDGDWQFDIFHMHRSLDSPHLPPKTPATPSVETPIAQPTRQPTPPPTRVALPPFEPGALQQADAPFSGVVGGAVAGGLVVIIMVVIRIYRKR